MSNSSGSYRSTRENSMAAFDKLPPTARAALANAAINWAPQPFRTRWMRGLKGYRTGPEIAETVVRIDTAQIKKDRACIWGIKDGKPTRNASRT